MEILIYVVLSILSAVASAFGFKLTFTKKVKNGTSKVKSDEQTLLEIKDVVRNYIYKKEELFKEVVFNTTGQIKTGSFKMDSVLKEAEFECMRRNYAYNGAYWEDFITNEVKKMKSVK